MSRGFILTKGNDEIVLNIAAIDKLDGDSVYFNEGPQVSGIDEDVMISLNEAIAAYNPGGGGPTPGPEPVPAPPAEPYYVDGWFDRPMNSVLVAAGKTWKISYSDDKTNWTTVSFPASDVDTWINMENQAFRQAKYICRADTSSSYSNVVKAMKLDLPNYCGTGKVVGNPANTFVNIFTYYTLVNLYLNIDHIEGDMSYAFSDNTKMITCEINMSNPDLCNTSKMLRMFQNCYSLQSLDLSGWNVSRVDDMSYMFQNCYSLQSLDLSGWNPYSVTKIEKVFSNCRSLQSLDLSGWDLSNVTTLSNMFEECYSLQTLDLSGWNTSNVTNMNSMFWHCYSLQTLDISGWDVSNVTLMGSMFASCYSLQSLDLSGWNVHGVTSIGNMFNNCHSLQSLDLSGWDVSNVANLEHTFSYCYALQSLDLSGWDVSNVTNMSRMFAECYTLHSLDLSGWNVSKLTNMGYMFNNCYALQSLDLTGWDISIVTNLGYTFYQCYSLATFKITSKPKTITFSFDSYSHNKVLNDASLKWIADNMIDITGDDSYTNKEIRGFVSEVKGRTMWNYFVETLTAKGYTVS